MRVLLPPIEGITLRGNPLQMIIAYSRPKMGSFNILGYVPLPSDYQSEFAEEIRGRMKTPMLGYVLFEINRSLDMPIYLAKFYIFSNMLEYHPQPNEKTPGLGKILLCKTLRYLSSQPWMQPFIASSENKIHLIAGGGQCTEKQSELEDKTLEECLTLIVAHPLSLQTMIEFCWVERECGVEDIVENIRMSRVIPKEVKQQFIDYELQGGEEDEDELQEIIINASQLIQFFRGRTSMMIKYVREQTKLYDDIELNLRSDLCRILDNRHLVEYYQRYGFQVTNWEDGMSVPMQARISQLITACEPKQQIPRFKGISSRKYPRSSKKSPRRTNSF